MAPPRKHDTDHILDAARTIALRDGPRATSVAAIAHESGAPAGTLYHRFGSRDRVLQEAWLRALGRFQTEALDAAGDPDPVDAGVAIAAAAVRFARRWPDDARLIAVVRRGDLLDGGTDPDFEERLAAMNAPLRNAVLRIARALGHTDAEGRETVLAAVVDLPEAAVRRHARDGSTVPAWLERSVATTARRLLTPADPGHTRRRPARQRGPGRPGT
jgi:AcrR family transcriptional regulator